MITFKTINFNTYDQESYDNDIKNIDYSKIKCTCNSTGNLHKHATYHRFLIIDNDDILLEITRIKCDSCGCTHALLPGIIIPYRILSNPDIIKIIQSFHHVSNSYNLIAGITGYSRETIKYLINLYLKYHLERLNVYSVTFGVPDFYSFSFIINYFSNNFIKYDHLYMKSISYSFSFDNRL